MTGRTHDLAGFTALSFVVAVQPPQDLTLSTALVALSANFIGALAPDIDQSTATLWRRIPAGGIWGRLLAPILGGHRMISHSILGVILFGLLLNFLLNLASTVVLVDMDIVWWSFMIGFVSHLITDMFTREGVPWLFPLPFNFGIPPLRALRFKTGGFIEKSLVFPSLILLNIWIYYSYYDKFLVILRNYIK
jgi:inner membrane protein